MSSVQAVRAFVAAALFLVCVSIAQAKTAADLIGVWEAKLRFGPDARGTLVVERAGRGWTVSVAGYRATIAPGEKIAFELPEGEARFRGHYDAKANTITGHWLQARTQFNGTFYATPVHFKATGARRWEGDVTPLDDAMTLFLRVSAAEGGNVTAFFRNPERNAGRFVEVSRITVDANDGVHVFGKTDEGEREVVTGRFDEENQILRLPIPSYGGTFDFNRSGASTPFYPRGAKPGRYVYRAPLSRDDGWRTGSLDEAGFSRTAIEAFVQKLIETPMDSIHALQVHSFVVARHGKLVVEEYFHGFNADMLHDTRSASKSVGATLIGAAMNAGYRIDAATPVYATMGAAAGEPRRAAMTLDHLLTMSPGFDCDDANSSSSGNEDVMQSQRKEPDWYRYTLALPMVAEPGTKTVYCSASPNLAGGVLARAAGKGLDELFEALIAKPLGIKRYAMNLMPTREAYMGGGLQITARDFVKFGQLMLDKGMWNGRRVVGEAFAARASSPLKSLRDLQYGYLWWVTDLPHKGGKVRAYYAGGNGGQVVMVVPELDLVVSFMGGSYGDRVFYTTQRVYVPEDILPAIVN